MINAIQYQNYFLYLQRNNKVNMRGGKREGSGRPKGKPKILLAIRFDEDLVQWLRSKVKYGEWLNRIVRREFNRERKKQVNNEKEK